MVALVILEKIFYFMVGVCKYALVGLLVYMGITFIERGFILFAIFAFLFALLTFVMALYTSAVNYFSPYIEAFINDDEDEVK